MSFPAGVPPLMRTPLTDFAAVLGLPDIQLNGTPQCKKFELNYFKCLEAYGLEKGYDKCSVYYEDLLECKYCEKQKARIMRIREEIDKQVKEGKRSYAQAPEVDAYYELRF